MLFTFSLCRLPTSTVAHLRLAVQNVRRYTFVECVFRVVDEMVKCDVRAFCFNERCVKYKPHAYRFSTLSHIAFTKTLELLSGAAMIGILFANRKHSGIQNWVRWDSMYGRVFLLTDALQYVRCARRAGNTHTLKAGANLWFNFIPSNSTTTKINWVCANSSRIAMPWR